MKKPKEIRNKTRPKKTDLINRLFKSFKTEFLKLKNKFNDSHIVKFLKVSKDSIENGRFSEVILSDNYARELFDVIYVVLEEEIIEVYFNLETINFRTFNNYPGKTLENNFEFFANFFIQTAQHEFGHTFLMRNSLIDFLPSEIKIFIKENNIEDINNIPKEIGRKYLDCFYNSRLYNVSNQLFFEVKYLFKNVVEFHANYDFF